MMGEISIIPFDPVYAKAFGDLNYEWIAKHYGIEEHDHAVLDHPVESVIEPGGQIFFAVENDVAVGTVAMIPLGVRSFELVKMAVSPAARGRGIGNLLMEACIAFAGGANAESIILESNTKQEAAIKLYRKYGFEEISPDPNSHFVRSNIRMELAIVPANL